MSFKDLNVDKPIGIFHIGYSDDTIASLPEGFELLDNSDNLRPDWFEFWPIKNFLENDSLENFRYYGFFSPKFFVKTGLRYADLIDFISATDDHVDAYIVSPQPEVGYIFRNIYHGSDFTDPGCLDTCKRLFDRIGIKCDLDLLIIDSRRTVFSNYIIASRRFWGEWLTICNQIYEIAENPLIDPVLYSELNSRTLYGNGVQRKVFVIEGIATLMLAFMNYTVCSIPLNEEIRGKGIYYNNSEKGILCDSLKISYNETGNPDFLKLFDVLSGESIKDFVSCVEMDEEESMKQTPAHDLYNDSIMSILKKIRPDSVIEVGCARGTLAREYMKEFPETKWTGIDIDMDNVVHAKSICSYAIQADIEKLSFMDLPNIDNVKVWVFGDVLEHLRDPWRVLKNVREHSPSGGRVVACIPNSQHWSFQVRVNSGMMQYQEDGLFDKTHLRFFSRSTIIQMFEEAGYTINGMFSRNFNFPGSEKYMPLIRSMAAISGIDPGQAEVDALAYQYVIEAMW